MSRGLAYVALLVRDYDEAIAYFTQKLGFSVREDTYIPEQQKRWVVIDPPGSEGTGIVLARPSTPEQSTFVGNQTGGRVSFFLGTQEFWRDFERLRSAGVTFVREPREETWGTVAVFTDLYGNLWDLLQPKERSDP